MSQAEPTRSIIMERPPERAELARIDAWWRAANWASTYDGAEPEVVLACAGDVPRPEALAAVDLLRGFFSGLRIRVVDVVDLMRLQDEHEHPHGLSRASFDSLFTRGKPVILGYHCCHWLMHRLTYRRTNHANIHVRGYNEEGATSAPFDMTVVSQIDRYDVAVEVLDDVDRLQATSGAAREELKNRLIPHKIHVQSHGEDVPEIRDWRWTPSPGPDVTTERPALDAPEG